MTKFFTSLNKYYKNKIGLLRFLIISFIVLNLYVSIVPNIKSQTEPPATGDWIISDTTVKSNCDIELDSDLKIENGGSLTLNYVKLKMKDLKSITVESGGSFYVYYSVIEGITKSDFYKFFVYGTMRIENSYVNETWGPDFGNMWESGIQILSDDVIIYNSTISNAKETAIGIESASPKIINCNIINNAYFGLIACKSSSIIVDGCIIDNPFHDISFGDNSKGTFTNSTTKGLILQDSCEVNLYKVQMEHVTIQRGVTTTFRDSTITGSIYMNENSHPIFLNTSFSETKIQQFDETCSITVQWNLNVRVESNMTGGISAALVKVGDNENGNFIKNFTTDNDGWVRGIICTEYIKKLETKEYYTPHFIIAKKGEENGNTNVDINSDKTVILTISNLTENYPPSEPTNIFPISTHNPIPTLTWSPSIDLNLDPITYHIDIWEGPSSNEIKIVEDATETDLNYKILNSLRYGGTYYVDIYAADDKGGKSSTVTHVLKIINQKPSAPEMHITPLTPRTTDDLKCSIITHSKDNDIDPMDKVLYAYEWYKDGILMDEFTIKNTDNVSHTIPSSKTQKGEVWKCVVTPNDGIENGTIAKAEVTIANSIPRIQDPIEPFKIREDHNDTQTVNLLDVFIDDDNDNLSFNKEGNVHINVLITQETGGVIFEPEPDWHGKEIITFIANDSISDTECRVEITVIPENDIPIIYHIKNKTVKINNWLNFTITAKDIDGDELSYKSNITTDSFYINPETGEVNFKPTKDDVGTLEIIISVEDNNGSKAFEVFYIIVDDDNSKPIDDKVEDENIMVYFIILFLVIFFIILISLILKRNKKDQYIDNYTTEKPTYPITQGERHASIPLTPPYISEKVHSQSQFKCPYCGFGLDVFHDGSILCQNCGYNDFKNY